MLILGLVSGYDQIPEIDLEEAHDSSAVLLRDGEVIAALEEERSSRIKHNGRTAITSGMFCLKQHKLKFSDIDRIVLHCREYEANQHTIDQYIFQRIDAKSARERACSIFREMTGELVPKEKIYFVEHHMCHAANAFYMSGFDKSLILTIDGPSPEGHAGYVISAEGDSWEVLDRILNEDSLGSFYTRTSMFLGCNKHEEHKVMGLAPYGDPGKYRPIMKKIYTLLPNGKYKINHGYFGLLYDYIEVRRKGEKITQDHKDLAAALQEALEAIVMHILEHYQKLTGHRRLCLGGEAALNCSMNGKILYSGLFDEMFVQPAAHDAGNALGAAIYAAKKEKETVTVMPHLFYGTEIGDAESVGRLLSKWDRLISCRKEEDIIEKTAGLLADGYVIGWVQGRSEFGPRALGHRSILADPRPAESKTMMNAMVKEIEGHLPFAPSILEEYLGEYYEVPQAKANLSFMNYVLQTKEDKKELLGAVTHVDGSARIQTVSKATNEKYWNLINAFREKTGIPILLNKSFHNDVEPLVDTEVDALACFLTTNINYLIIGDYFIEKKQASTDDYLYMIPGLPFEGKVMRTVKTDGKGQRHTQYIVRIDYRDKHIEETKENVYRLLDRCDGKKTVRDLLEECRIEREEWTEIVNELIRLWSRRVIKLTF